jgi:hypothetical protein
MNLGRTTLQRMCRLIGSRIPYSKQNPPYESEALGSVVGYRPNWWYNRFSPKMGMTTVSVHIGSQNFGAPCSPPLPLYRRLLVQNRSPETAA